MLDGRTRVLLTLALGFGVASPVGAKSADLVIRGGAIYTGGPGMAQVSAIAVQDGAIVYLGDEAGVAPFIDRKTRVLSLGEKTLYPGFVNSWFRAADYARSLTMPDVSGARTFDEVVRLMTRAARKASPNEWIIARGLDLEILTTEGISLVDLTNATGRHPACLFHATDNAILANAHVFDIAGVGPEYPNPPGGRVVRNAYGQITGIVTDQVAEVFRLVMPRPTAPELAALLRTAADTAAACGFTMLCDPSVTPDDLPALELLAREKKKLPVRIQGALNGTWRDIQPLLARGPVSLSGGRIEIRSVSIPLDGGFNTGGAILYKAYDDERYNAGVPAPSPEELQAEVEAISAAGFSAWILATGDRAVDLAVQALEAASSGGSFQAAMPRLIGGDLVLPDTVERLRGTGVPLTILPGRWSASRVWLKERLGQRASDAYNWRALAGAGVPLRLGSGAPMARPDPVRDFTDAVTNPNGLSREEALGALTGAVELKAGGRADFTILSRDILKIEEEDLAGALPVLTIVDGEVVFERSDNP